MKMGETHDLMPLLMVEVTLLGKPCSEKKSCRFVSNIREFWSVEKRLPRPAVNGDQLKQSR
jgi:hypothetical protein